MDKLLEDIENSDDDDDDFKEGESPDVEPRRIPCSFYFFLESKLRIKWETRKDQTKESLYAFSKRMVQKWKLLNDSEREVDFSYLYHLEIPKG